MSISKNKGDSIRLSAKIWASKSYKKLKSSGKKFLKICLMDFILQEILKMGLSLQMPGNLFEDLGASLYRANRWS